MGMALPETTCLLVYVPGGTQRERENAEADSSYLSLSRKYADFFAKPRLVYSHFWSPLLVATQQKTFQRQPCCQDSSLQR